MTFEHSHENTCAMSTFLPLRVDSVELALLLMRQVSARVLQARYAAVAGLGRHLVEETGFVGRD